MSVSTDGSSGIDPKHTANVGGFSQERILGLAGLMFAGSFLFCTLYIVGGLVIREPQIVETQKADGVFEFIYRNYPREFFVLLLAVASALLALRFFSKIGSLQSQIIRREDRDLLEPLISGPNSDAIDQYIRLSALSGFSGTFTKLGFTGLPLATIALTIGLIVMAVFVSDGERAQQIMELGKLTLGAFIGSFVQRNIEQRRSPGESPRPSPESFS